jgi:mono/diheme cytochrome c family protein
MHIVILAASYRQERGQRFRDSWNRVRPLRTRIFTQSILLFLVLGMVEFALAGCRSKDALTPQEAEGKHLYDIRCEHCHGENDMNIKPPPPDLHGLFAKEALPSGAPATDAEVQQVVLGGKGMMPAFAGRFTNEQMADLLAYLHRGIR